MKSMGKLEDKKKLNKKCKHEWRQLLTKDMFVESMSVYSGSYPLFYCIKCLVQINK